MHDCYEIGVTQKLLQILRCIRWGKPVEMESMVQGHSSVLKPKRHADAIKERTRKDFHFQSTTLRFKAIAEYGEWEGQTNVLPGLTR